MNEKNNNENIRSEVTQDIEELAQLEKESVEQKLPEQKTVFKTESIKTRAGRRGVHNLPDQTNPPMGFDPDKAFDSVFPFLKLPYLQPNTPEDVISFGSPQAGGYLGSGRKKIPLNAIFFGDNLHILRALPSNCIDLIYIDPPFFSGRTYNQLWGDDNEVRTFYDLWEDGLPSYLVWLNARLWEMRRALKDTGSIYVHCDWHASHYIKCEADKIFGYNKLLNEIAWSYETYQGNVKKYFARKHDAILLYIKSKAYTFHQQQLDDYEDSINYKRWEKYIVDGNKIKGNYYPKTDSRFMQRYNKWVRVHGRKPNPDDVIFEIKSFAVSSAWHDVKPVDPKDKSERIGYPTQKPEKLLERIIEASSNKGDIVADFFMGGGTTCAVAQKLNRKFIGCDSSRVAVSVALNRIIRDGEEISGRTASVNMAKPKKKNEQLSLKMTIKPIPDLRLYYMGVYPIEKFEFMQQKEFEDFILTCYAARRFTGEGRISGIMNASTSLLIGSVKPNESISEKQLRKYVEDVLMLRYQKNIKMKLKVISWVFPKSLQKYARILENYFAKKNLSVAIELIPINSQLFRKRILEHYPDASKNEFLLKFISQASIMDIAYKKIDGLKYGFAAVGARSNNIDGRLINCQWDFNFIEGRFAEREYALMREQKDGKYVAVLTAEKDFEKPGKYIVACRVQDNLGGEAIKTKEIVIT